AMARCSGTCWSRASTSRRRSSRRSSRRRRTATTRSSGRSRPSRASVAELWDEIAHRAAEESSLWADCLRADPDRTAVFSPLGSAEHALGLETIYEGYLVHYGRSRLFE